MGVDCFMVMFDGCVNVSLRNLSSSLYNKLEKINWNDKSTCILQGSTENRLYDNNYWSCPIVIDLHLSKQTYGCVDREYVSKDLKHLYRRKCESTAVCLKLALNEEHDSIVNTTINYASDQCQLTEVDITELRAFLTEPGIIAGSWLVTIYSYTK